MFCRVKSNSNLWLQNKSFRGSQMKKAGPILLKRYSEMSGDKKVRLGLRLSEMVRQVRKEGKVATGA